MAQPPADPVRSLYEAPPDGFVAARAAAVAAARKAGDAAGARQLAALRKPTVAAWLVNLLALRRPELVGELVDLAAALRSAQRNLRGDQLRELSTQRRQAVSALVAQARALAVEADPALAAGKLPLGDVESTLSAALADEEVAALVRTGRLVRTLSYDGFGEVPRPRLRLLTGGDPPVDADAEPTDTRGDAGDGAAGRAGDGAAGRAGGARAGAGTPRQDDARVRAQQRRAEEERRRRAAARRAVEKEVVAAETALHDAEERAEEAADAERDALRAVADLEAELAELERRRSAAQADVGRLKMVHRAAQRDAAMARRRFGEAQAALDDLTD